MKTRLFSTDQQPKDLIRQNSDVNLDKDSLRVKQMRQMRQMKSVNKGIGTKKKHFFFQEGQKIVGDYKFDVRKEIGSGYSSKVYKAISLKDNLDYAIKAVEFNNFKPSHFEMLENEIKILKKMSHTNVIKFYSVSKTATHLYIITEFCQKGDLLTYMTRKGILPQKQALDIFSDILRGVQYVHKMGIIHRDIKPGNILYDGKSWKVADFGFSVESKEEIRTRNNVGTPLYMPLEALEKNLYSAESDIFSVGVVLYELLVGITPWQCRDEEQLVKKLKNIEFRIPEKIKISPQIKELLKKLCQPLRENRMTRKQFLNLDPATFKNFESSVNIFKKDSFEVKKESTASPMKKELTSLKKIIGEFKIQQVEDKPEVKRNEMNMFVNGKMKKSSENVKTETTSVKELSKIKSASNLFSSHNPSQNNEESSIKSSAMFRERAQKSNRNLLLSILNFCRFMYYLMKNSEHLELQDINRQKLKILLLKHCLLILKLLTDTENNWFRLQSYEYYKETRGYYKLYSSFQEYLTKYEKEYQTMVRRAEVTIVKEINQKITEFNREELCYLSQGFYEKMRGYVAPILRENNHNLASQIYSSKKRSTEETKPKIQGIKNFLKYFQILQTLTKQDSRQYFEHNPQIQVIKSYHDSPATIEEFMNLRKAMKYV